MSFYRCHYLYRRTNGRIKIKKLKCEFGCCGTLQNQKCCPESLDIADAHTWQIVASVTCSLFVLCVLFIIILCAVKKNNLARSRTATSPRVTYTSDSDTRDSFVALEPAAPPPPYSARDCNIFIIGNTADQVQGQGQRSGTEGHFQDPPAYSDK